MRISGWLFPLLCVPALGRTPFWAPLEPPRATYHIEARIAPETGRIEGSEIIRFHNHTNRPIGRLAFAFGGSEMAMEGAAAVVGASSPKLFELAREIGAGESAELKVKFALARAAWRDGQGVTLQSWHPRLWWGFGVLSDYEVKVSVPDGYTVASSGRFSDGVHRGTNVRVFALFVGKGFESSTSESAGVQVRAVFKPEASKCAEVLLKTAVDAIAFYKQRFGVYPHQSLTIVPGSDYPAGGYPIATAMVAVHGQAWMSERQTDWWPWITAHEIGHMYWSEYVLAQGADNLDWLMIGLGIHADREYRRARGIKNAGELWLTYASGVTKGYDTTMDLTRMQERGIKWDFGNVVVHGKSSAMLNALESVLGKDVFEAVYLRCLRDYAAKRLGWREFQRVAELESGQNLEWFFDAWVRSPDHAGYEVAEQSCSEGECAVRIRKTGALRMPVVVAARFDDGTEQRAVTDRLADVDTLRFRSNAGMKMVTIDPDREVAMPEPPPVNSKNLKDQIGELPWTGAGDQALAFYKTLQDVGLQDTSVLRKLALLMYDGRHYAEALAAFGDMEKSSEPAVRFMGLVWEAHILDLTGKRAEALAKYEEALKVPGDPSMQHGQYDIVIDRKWVEERLKRPFTR